MNSSNWHRFLTAVGHRLASEEGQAVIEYALVLALIAVLTIGVLQALGLNISAGLSRVSSNMTAVSNP
jgi:Flp pilus assembly pilin Flp